MTNHDRFWWPSCTACVNECTAISWFLIILSVLNFIFFILRIIFCHTNFNELIPCENFSFHWSWEILWNRIFPNHKILNFWNSINYLGIFLKLNSVFQYNNFTFRMISDILTWLCSICCINSYWKIVTKYWTSKSNSPLMRIKPYNIYWCEISNF